MAFDDTNNFAYSLVATAPAPKISGATLIVTAGEGALFPTAPFNAIAAPAGVLPLASNSEIVRVTIVAVDTLTITRAQEGTTAKNIDVGWCIYVAVTEKVLTDITAAIPPVGSTVWYAGTGDPAGGLLGGAGWVIADGRLIDRTTYADFYAECGFDWNGGADPGSNKTRIPDLRGKFPLGAINQGSAAGAGTNDNAHSQQARGSAAAGGEVNHALAAIELASHSHGGATGAMSANASHSHAPLDGGASTFVESNASGGLVLQTGAGFTQKAIATTASVSLAHTHSIAADGLGAAHNNMPPHQAGAFLVRIA